MVEPTPTPPLRFTSPKKYQQAHDQSGKAEQRNYHFTLQFTSMQILDRKNQWKSFLQAYWE